MMDCPNEFTEAECETQNHNIEDSNTDVQTDTVQNTTTVEIHNTTQEGESTTEDIEQFQSVQKVAFSKTNSTKNSKASVKKNYNEIWTKNNGNIYENTSLIWT
jgi:hypothetical protein